MPFPLKEGNIENIMPVIKQITQPPFVEEILTVPEPKENSWKRDLEQNINSNRIKRRILEKQMGEIELGYARLSLEERIQKIMDFNLNSSLTIQYLAGCDSFRLIETQFKLKYISSILEKLKELGQLSKSEKRALFSKESQIKALNDFKLLYYNYEKMFYKLVLSRIKDLEGDINNSNVQKYGHKHARQLAKELEKNMLEISPGFITLVLSYEDPTLEKVVNGELEKSPVYKNKEKFFSYTPKFDNSYFIAFRSVLDVLCQLDKRFEELKIMEARLASRGEALYNKTGEEFPIIKASDSLLISYELEKAFDFLTDNTCIKGEVESPPYAKFIEEISEKGKNFVHYDAHYDSKRRKISPHAIIMEYVYKKLKKSGLKADYCASGNPSINIRGRKPTYLYFYFGWDAGFFYATYETRLDRDALAYVLRRAAIVLPILGEALAKNEDMLKSAAIKRIYAAK